MKNQRTLVVAGIGLALVVTVGAYLAFRGTGGAGQDRTFNVTVTGSTMSPDTITVKQNDRVIINLTVDKTEEIHVHGYEIIHTVDAGKTVAYSFTAGRTGNFDIEIETTSKLIGHLIVNP